MVWTLPALFLIKHFQDDMWIGLKQMFSTKPKWFKDAPVLFVVFAPSVIAFVRHGGLVTDPDFVPERLIGAVLRLDVEKE